MIDISRLKSQLLISGIQKKDPPLFQVIDQLIRLVGDSLTISSSLLSSSSGSGGGSGKQGIQGMPGINGQDGLDGEDGFPGRDGTITTNGYWTLLTDGNVDETDLIFANSEPVLLFIPVP